MSTNETLAREAAKEVCDGYQVSSDGELFKTVYETSLLKLNTATQQQEVELEKLREDKEDAVALRQLEKLAWSGKVNHHALAPYRYSKTDEKRIAIYAMPTNEDPTMNGEELGDGATLREAINNATNDRKDEKEWPL